jgi:hypothetical protein
VLHSGPGLKRREGGSMMRLFRRHRSCPPEVMAGLYALLDDPALARGRKMITDMGIFYAVYGRAA